jgi:hypothetical protein
MQRPQAVTQVCYRGGKFENEEKKNRVQNFEVFLMLANEGDILLTDYYCKTNVKSRRKVTSTTISKIKNLE